MVSVITGNIFKSSAEAFVNPVNCVGTMGAGLAKQFKKRFPNNFESYYEACVKRRIYLGKVYIYSLEGKESLKYIVNFPTKNLFRTKSTLENIKLGLKDLEYRVIEYSMASIAIPALGCGLGGLRWDNVKPLLLEFAGRLPDVTIIIYAPL